jgi:hypothetical protein
MTYLARITALAGLSLLTKESVVTITVYITTIVLKIYMYTYYGPDEEKP